MYMTEISEDKYDCLSEYIGKGIKYLGKAMHCIEEMQNNTEEDDEEAETYSARKTTPRIRSRYNRY